MGQYLCNTPWPEFEEGVDLYNGHIRFGAARGKGVHASLGLSM